MSDPQMNNVWPHNAARRKAIMDMLERLEDLRKQATVERSHFYTGRIATDATDLLYALLSETPE